MQVRSSPCRSSRAFPVLAPMLLVSALLPPPATAAAQSPTVTFVAGDSILLSGGRAFVPAPGVRLRSCDAMRTGPDAMVQVEFGDGTAVLLGPETRFVFDLPPSGGSAEATQFLHSGWAKVTSAQAANAPPNRVRTPGFDLSIGTGVAVLHIDSAGTQVYVERGAAAALDPAAQPPARITVRAGNTYTHMADQSTGALRSGVEPSFASAVPRTLRDTLPMRLDKVKDRDVQPRAAGTQAGADGWLGSAPELRACSSGDDGIRAAQEMLARKGFDVGPIDGVLGARTQAALRAFQSRSGLRPSGRLDAETLRLLDEGGSR